MDSLFWRAVIAGILFGLWPLLMNRSGLNGHTATVFLVAIGFAVILPFTIWNGLIFPAIVQWKLVVTAGLLTVVGLIIFNGALAKASPQKVGTLVVVMLVSQMIVPAVYQVIMDQRLEPVKILGFLAAILAAFLLA